MENDPLSHSSPSSDKAAKDAALLKELINRALKDHDEKKEKTSTLSEEERELVYRDNEKNEPYWRR